MTLKKTFFLTIGILTVIALVMTIPVAADGGVDFPHQFYGSLAINGAPAQANTQVIAFLNGVNSGEIQSSVGQYGGPGDWDPKLVVTGQQSDVGSTIWFLVGVDGGHWASQTATYTPNTVQNLALTVTYATPTPTPTPITPTPTPTTPTPTPTTPTPTPTPSPTINKIARGGDVFIGEEGLDVTAAVGSFSQIAWFAPGTNPSTDAPNYVLPVGNSASFYVAPTDFVGRTGPWHRWDGGATRNQEAFNARDPEIMIFIYAHTQDVSGLSMGVGSFGNFRIESNLYTITQRQGYTGQGIMTLKVQGPNGNIYSALEQSLSISRKLTDLNVNQQVWYWVPPHNSPQVGTNGWNTALKDQNGARLYQDGMYRVWAESNVNGMKDNYRDPTGGEYIGKTVSYQKTVLLQDKGLVLSSPGSVVRGNNFIVNLTGNPNTDYVLWIRYGCEKMSGGECDQPPTIQYNQEGVSRDTSLAATCFDCAGCIKHIAEVVAPKQYPEDYYVRVTTTWSGTRTINFLTSIDTAPGRTYTIAALEITPDLFTEPNIPVETSVTVNKGAVAFDLYGYGTPVSATYLGEKIWIRGTNTDPSGYVYLLMTGPCQDCVGANLNGVTVQHGNAATFTKVQVKSDNTWDYLWDTSNLKIDLGDYTIYATSKPDDAAALEGKLCDDCDTLNTSCAAWAKRPLRFLDPTITADIQPKVLKIVCCDPPAITVTGHATGLRNDECVGCSAKCEKIAFWVFGENKVAGNKYLFSTLDIDCPSGSFAFNLAKYMNTLKLEPGTYTVIVQHPMYNHRLDILPEDWIYPVYNEPYSFDLNRQFVVSSSPIRWSKLFVIDGPDRLVGTNASQALIQGFSNPNVDDKIVVLTFKVESNTVLQADFSGSPTTGVAPLQVQFSDLSTGGPSTWSWSFGDGSTSTVKNPTHTYTGPGGYDVSLTITNAAGSSMITKTGYITVTQVGPTPTQTIPPQPADVINLYTGWNFVSTPRTLADASDTVGVVFADVNTGGRSIYLYDAGTGLWFAMGASDQFKPLDGIWIYSTTPKQVNLVFKSGGATTPPTKNVYLGWNAIGFAGESARSAQATLVTVDDEWRKVIGWNAASQKYNDPIANVPPDYTEQMYPTRGYWLFMNGMNPPWVLS